MPSDAWPNKPTNKSLESTKETFKKRLDAILYKQLTPENIEIFADQALAETVTLTDDILREYKDNPSFHPNLNLRTLKQEDEAFKTLERLGTIENSGTESYDLAATYAVLLAGVGKKKEAEEKIKFAIQHGQGVSHFHHAEHLIASAYALSGDSALAVEWLHIAPARAGAPLDSRTIAARLRRSREAASRPRRRARPRHRRAAWPGRVPRERDPANLSRLAAAATV